MSFCILTLIISPGLPRMPPKNPAVAAMARRTGKSIGSPFGDILCLRICWCIITNHICLTLNLWVYLLASVRSRHLYRIGSQYLRTFTIVFYQPQSGKVTGWHQVLKFTTQYYTIPQASLHQKSHCGCPTRASEKRREQSRVSFHCGSE